MVVELKQDMLTIKEPPKVVLPCFKNSLGTGFEDHAFFEAASIRKIKDKYYLIYSSQQLHELCYATSSYPDKGFKYGGVIISNGDIGYKGRKPEDSLAYTGNNHGGLAEIEHQWYIFYHRHTAATQFSRQGCAEPIFIAEDGSIAQAEMTSCGLNRGPLPGRGTFSAHIACNLIGPKGSCSLVRKEGLKETEPYIYEEACGTKEEDRNQYIANIKSGTKIGFKYFFFQNDIKKLSLSIRGSAKGCLEVYLDSPNGALISEVKISINSKLWSAVEAAFKSIQGIHGIFIVYSGQGFIEFNSMSFE
jgi:hypothetical protein